jgi:PAS domain S-box-containing protein
MESQIFKVLLIDDDEDDYVVTRDLLEEAEQARFRLAWVDNYSEGLEAIHAGSYDVYLVDYFLGAETGLDLLKVAAVLGINKPIILLTGAGNNDVDQQSMALGAADYLVKGIHLNSTLLERSILHAIERHRAKEKISLLTYALESLHDGIYVTTDDDQLLFTNQALKRLCNASISDFQAIGQSLNSYPVLNRFLFLNRGRASGKVLQVELTLEAELPEKVRTVMLVESLVQVQHRTLRFGILHDITDRKQTEIALEKAQHIYQEAERIAHIGSWELNLKTNDLYWSAEVFKIFDLEPETFGASYEAFLSAIHPDDRDLVNQAYAQHLRDRCPFDLVHRLLLADGRVKYVREKCASIFGSDGTPLLSRGIVQDVTQLREAQLALEHLNAELEQRVEERTVALTKSQNQFQRLVDDIGEKFVVFSYTNSIVSYVSRGFEATFGMSTQAILGQSWQTAIHWLPESLQLAQTQIQEMLDTKANAQELELQFIHPNGQVRTIHVTQHPVWDQAGNLSAIEGVAEDITARKEYEAQLQRSNEELIQATRLKDEFLANMSHELRTPLNSILGMTEVLEEELLGPITEGQQNALQTIQRSGSHLLDLINEILDLAKIESGQMELEQHPTTIASLCKLSLTFIKQLAHNKNLQVHANIPENLPELMLDERRMNQALINLLNNAVKFTPEGGQIHLDVCYPSPMSMPSHDQRNGDCSAQFLRLSITDTGIGIAPENIPKLFKPFVQIDSALNRKYEGTGLGLALVKDIVELHGGIVGVTSEEGVGSCFTVDLPCLTCDIAPPPEMNLNPENASMPESLNRPSTLILLVEDDEANIKTISTYLEAKGYEICCATNGLEALEMVQAKHPDLILMDVQMPEMDGLEATQKIRQMPDVAAIPIIALTALAMEGDREKCLEAGATMYLGKPVKLKQLVSQIQTLLEGDLAS